MNEKTTNRNLAIDVLKIFAIIMLIGCHTYNVNVPIFDVAVPLFLVIRGFNYATSMKKKNITIKSYYSKDNLSIKFKRILIPYFYFAIFEILLVLFSGNFTLTNFFRILFLGGLGMGSFYTILLIQIILVFPFIFKFIKNKKYFALICLFIIYFAFELLFNRVFDISNNIIYELWRNLIFRQIFYISCGCFIALNKNKILNILSYICVAIGSALYILYNIGIYKPFLLLTWPATQIQFGLLAIGLVYIFTNIIIIKKENKILMTISNSTYHIFLVQQAYFYISHELYFSPYYSIWFNIFVCCFVGILFYLSQTKISKLLKK